MMSAFTMKLRSCSVSPLKSVWTAVALTVATAAAAPSHAEPIIDRALSQLQVIHKSGCAVMRVEFNLRVRYAGHFPTNHGKELRVTVQPVDNTELAIMRSLRREALRAPQLGNARVVAVELQSDQPGGPVLRFQFDRDVGFDVAQGPDFQSIVVAVGADGKHSCKALLPSGPAGQWRTDVTFDQEFPLAAPSLEVPVAATARGRGKGKLGEEEKRAAAAKMDEARAAMRKHDYPRAIALFRKVLSYPETDVSADAQELLALCYQKAGRISEARAELEDYVSRYPAGEASERMRQRLDAILTRDAAQGERLHKPRSARADNGETTWTVSGSASQFYIRDDSFRTLRDPSLPPNPNEDIDAHRVHVNTLLTGLDLIATMSNADMKAKFRFSGTEEFRLADDRSLTGVSQLLLDVTLREYDLRTVVGRQTRNSGGVQGRFDGALVSWQSTPWLRINAVGGSPVISRYDEPFQDDRYLYGVSADFGPFFGGFDATVFAIEQRDRNLVDRRAVGTELRYIDANKSAFATIDYDVYFNELNAAILSGSWTFADKSNLHGGIDYRKSPYLSAWTALQNQPFVSLYDMLKAFTKDEIDRLAIDRTPTYRAANIGYSMPLNANLQATFDFTAANTTGMPASGGVPEIKGTGWEYYYSTQLIAQNVFSEKDVYIAGLRVADRTDSNLYVVDLSARYPLTATLSINPRLQLGYRKGDKIDLTEYTVMPSVLFNYYLTPELSFELETGARWTETHMGPATETNTELFVTAGVRYDFYADGRTPCAFPVTTCPPRR